MKILLKLRVFLADLLFRLSMFIDPRSLIDLVEEKKEVGDAPLFRPELVKMATAPIPDRRIDSLSLPKIQQLGPAPYSPITLDRRVDSLAKQMDDDLAAMNAGFATTTKPSKK